MNQPNQNTTANEFKKCSTIGKPAVNASIECEDDPIRNAIHAVNCLTKDSRWTRVVKGSKHIVVEHESTRNDSEEMVKEETHLGLIAEPGPTNNLSGADGLPTGLGVIPDFVKEENSFITIVAIDAAIVKANL